MLAATLADALSAQDDRLSILLMRDAVNPETAPIRLEALGRSDFASVRYGVAGNVHTPAAALNRLAHDADLDVRMAVARNSSTPEATLVVMTRDKSYALRSLLASHCEGPLEVFQHLARDGQVGIRTALARNLSTPPEILEEMANTALDGQCPKGNSEFDEPRSLLWVIASHPSTPATTLTRLARCNHAEVREAVAGNRATPATIVGDLSEDLDSSVRTAAEEATPPSLMEKLGSMFSGRRR